MIDLDYLYAHHAVGLCPEERCVAARERLAALVERREFRFTSWEDFTLVITVDDTDPGDMGESRMVTDYDNQTSYVSVRAALQDRVASREGSGTP